MTLREIVRLVPTPLSRALGAGALCALVLGSVNGRAAELAPFAASYEVVFRGINAGTSSLELSREKNGQWRYASRNTARGLFRLALPGEISQVSLFTLSDAGVRPLRYSADDGTDSTDRDIDLSFDWAAARVSGTAEKARVDLPIPYGLQDGMSVQIALIHALSQGGSPRGFQLIDKDEIKDYVYSSENPVRLRTAVGELDTVVWSSQRANSNRLTRVWYAPSLGYLPVQAERRRGDKVEWSMRIKTYRR